MRLRTNFFCAALVPLALFSVTSCAGIGSGDSKAGSSASQDAGDPSSDGGKDTEGSGNGDPEQGGSESGAGGNSGPLPACTSDVLKVTVGESKASDAPVAYEMFLKNKGGTACSVEAWPTVEMNTREGVTVNQGQTNRGPGKRPVVLKPGDSASGSFTYDGPVSCDEDEPPIADAVSVTVNKGVTLSPQKLAERVVICSDITVQSWARFQYQ